MGERLFKGLLIGLIAAVGAYLIEADFRVALVVAAAPAIFGFFDLDDTTRFFALSSIWGGSSHVELHALRPLRGRDFEEGSELLAVIVKLGLLHRPDTLLCAMEGT